MQNLFVLIVTSLISLALTIPTIIFAKKIGLVTDKKKRFHPAHTHNGIVPRGGGIPIFLSLLTSSLIFLLINHIVIGILIAGFLLVIIGLIDDYGDVSPYARFIANLFVSALVIAFGLGIPYISNPLGEVIRLDQWQINFNFFGSHSIWVIADLLAIIWLSWTMNMVNWSKGVDGQLPGFVAIAGIFLGLLSNRFTAHDISAQNVTTLSFIVAGSYLGFLPFNFYPQKIMPGYGGGALAGFLLGILSILSFGKVGTAILILSIPMIDAIYTIIRRLIKKRSPFKADWGHFHHRLLEIGWGKRRIAVFYWIITLILGISSLFLKGIEKLLAFISIAIMLLIFIFIIEKMKKERLSFPEKL
ncbi:MAG: UDP-N-acetylmuramyl pentapeptide phosphotransferase/UDP-N-acetylglucosamine-1-phosphate transferase [Candidatus Roizmanbacteria bacterium GW2011_GWA2_36_23]|uniref:UDP-N-acetylmuramyl pentapeptide phosphotransferase/UDP-N-acetylglucosamine-1-phosphate transferase n=1 Tax=Candidatus Roizmanbacteria bacterium GW2011_GWA2_36_23 TaxID=1618480 RepID=A0A0G0EM03_9BACT|nr:MAG: UDP-N-acetylmuramyl pentapeptide phosphotransferase/UDP-N-acetylglucosamine-1-phosphate transferase [Candidatus Roizmanbacteria bacterium GW2011_GWA2_36_23]